VRIQLIAFGGSGFFDDRPAAALNLVCRARLSFEPLSQLLEAYSDSAHPFSSALKVSARATIPSTRSRHSLASTRSLLSGIAVPQPQ
jgi:hypothetical protein